MSVPLCTLSAPSVSAKPTSATARRAESLDSEASATRFTSAGAGPTTVIRFPAKLRRKTGPTCAHAAARKPGGSALYASAWPRSGTAPGA
eukprot:6162946-Prymnesium_polylepis.2